MKVSEYIANKLVDLGAKQVFMVTGGGAMFLNYALGKHPNLKTIFHHHEQAAAMAAEGYARVTGIPGVLNVTTGPGGINALNGVYGAHTDSIPMLILSGQVKRETFAGTYNIPGLRQLGDQEVDIVSIVQKLTKFAVTVTNPEEIRFYLEKCWHLAITGRPGPCWLDIPIDVQSSQIDEFGLKEYVAELNPNHTSSQLVNLVSQALVRLKAARRPVIMAGTGVRAAEAVDVFNRVIPKLGVPVTTAWTHDIIDSDHPLFCGRPGTIGTRAGNFAVQNSDVLLIIGSRLNIRQTGYAWKSFAREAYKIWVDVDAAELNKPTVKPDLPILSDAKQFLEEIERQIEAGTWIATQFKDWLAWCKERVERYPPVLPKHHEYNGRINPYHFIEILFDNLLKEDVVVCGNATATIVPFQVSRLKLGQRLISNSGSASMGYDLPAAIGAAVARGGKRVICLAGDGSLQMNLQELQTIVHYNLPVKILVLNNNGYLSIRSSQQGFFGDVVGESSGSGISFPDMVKIARAYGIPACRLDKSDFGQSLREVLDSDGPILCDVLMDPEQGFEPRQRSRQLPDGRIVSAPLEDMYPFLEREEFKQNLLIPPWQD